MACTYDVTTNRGKVRLLIGDTSTTSCTFADTEIDAFLTMASNSLLLAASYALEAWASAVSGSMKSEKIGDYSYSKDDSAAKMALAEKYRKEDALTPYMTWAEMNLSGLSDTTIDEDIE